jgi:hypothetical protein
MNLKMERTGSSETSVTQYQSLWRHVQEGNNLGSHRHVNLEVQNLNLVHKDRVYIKAVKFC